MVSKNAARDILASLPSDGMRDRRDSFDDYVGSMSQSATFDLDDAPGSSSEEEVEPPLPPQRHSTGSIHVTRGEQAPIDQWSPKKSFLVS